MKLLVTLIAGALLPVAARGDCVRELTDFLGELAERHRAAETRGLARRASASVPSVCSEARDVPAAAERIVAALGDPAVRVMSASHFERTLEEWTGNPVAGVGLTEVLSIDIDEQTGLLTVIAPVPGSPAANAGLRAGDVVATIDGAETDGLGLTRSMQRLRIAAGARIELGVLRDDRLQALTLRAAELPPLEAVDVERLQLGDRNVLHVRLKQFVPGAAGRLRNAIERSTDTYAVVLDLRDNPGGLVDELRQAAGVFLRPGMSIARMGGPEPAVLSVSGDAEPVETPLYVVIGAGSASAAEALAGALQAHGRARLYGGRSFGKGLVHQTLSMANGTIVMFPTGELETPAGRPILGHGVDPDVRTSNPLAAIESDLGR